MSPNVFQPSKQVTKRGTFAIASGALVWASLAPTHAQAQATTWPAHNRYFELSAGQQQQNCREQDTQGITANGTLNTETGRQQNLGAAISFQTTSGWLLGLNAQRQTGATAYNGYLQAGNGSLNPHAANSSSCYFREST